MFAQVARKGLSFGGDDGMETMAHDERGHQRRDSTHIQRGADGVVSASGVVAALKVAGSTPAATPNAA
eukprot:11211426-Lingulodinium_polyedra.AAC.1